MFKKILVATDGSELSRKAALQGMELARLFGARLQILYVIDQRVFFMPHDIQALAPENPYFSILEDLRKNAQQVLDGLARQAKKRDVQFEIAVREGAVVDVITDTSLKMKADLLIIGAHGKTGEQRGFMGSTAQALSAAAPSSILIVRKK